MKNIVKFSFVILVLLFSSLSIPRQVSAAILFQDDFNDEDLNSVLTRWEIPRNSCGGSWTLDSGRIGISISGSVCETEFAPRDSVWDGWNNYIYEVDATFVRGTDKNFAFRYNSSSFTFYDYHFQVGSRDSRVILERIKKPPKYTNETRYPATNGNTYHIKIVANENHLTLYIDNNLVLDYPDAGGVSNTGKIALRAGVGGDPVTEVYFDNILVTSIDPDPTPTPTSTPTPTISPSTPIVIIPGLGGSWCKQAITTGGDCPGDWTALSEPIDPYDSLVSSIIDAPDITDSDVYVWYYDWRDRITDLSSRLSTYIDSTVLNGRPPGTQVKIVGHSYGGLIGSKYAEDNSTKVAKIVTAGSPHQGAVNAYGAWEGGELWGFSAWKRMAIRLLLSARSENFRTLKDLIQNDIVSIQQILPTFDYLTDTSDQTISETSMNQRNPQLPSQYSGLSGISSFLSTLTGLENITDDTLLSIKTKSRNWREQALGLWPDGVPDVFSYSSEGDTTVLRSSGRYTGASGIPEVAATHTGLISETAGINSILSQLGSTAAANIVESALDDDSGHAVLFLRSSATMTVDVNGNTYADQDGIIVLQNISGDTTANVTVTGTGDGAYHLDVLQFHPTGDSSTTYGSTIRQGENHSLTLLLNPSSPSDNPLQDNQGSAFLSFALGKTNDMSSVIESFSGRIRVKRLIQAEISAINSTISRGRNQVNSPLLGRKTVESTILRLHRLRENLNNYQNQGLDADTGLKLSNLSHEAIELLQSAYNAYAVRSGNLQTAFQLGKNIALTSRSETAVNNRAATATRGLTPAAAATELGRTDHQTAQDVQTTSPGLSYINSLSARMYFNEALKVLK